jgi:TM2 domain-containing membrane protein YozV
MDALPDLSYRASIRYWEKPTLDYTIYWVLTVFLGWAGLDYFYLGSPLMGILKLVLTFLTLGYWWVYDALNATFNKEQVEFAGPFVPVWGPTGIGAGRFTSASRPPPSNPEEAAKHTHFLFYGLALFVLGIFGADSYVAGDTLSGFIRLASLLSIVFSPIAIAWYIFSIYRYVIRTDQCLDTFWVYFGAPKPADGDLCPNVLESFTIWILKTGVVVLKLIPGLSPLVSMVEGLIENLEAAYRVAAPVVWGAVDTAANTVKAGATAAHTIQEGLNAPPPSAFAQAKADALQQAQQQGGGLGIETANPALSLLSVAVIGTVLVSAVSLTFWRAYQKIRNGSGTQGTPESADKRGGEEHNDVPPDPTLSGESAE